MSLKLIEWIVYLAIMLITCTILLLCRPHISFTPQGIALPMTKEAASAITSNPQWQGTMMPTHWVNLEYHTTYDSKIGQQKVFGAAKALAQQAGTTSIMMQPIQFGASTIADGMLSILIGRGIGLIQKPLPISTNTTTKPKK